MRVRHSHRTLAALLVAMLVAALPALAQDQKTATTPPPAQPPERTVKVLRVDDARNVAQLLGSFNVTVSLSERLGLISIAGSPEDVIRAEQAVHEIERLTQQTPTSIAQDVELTAHFLGIVDEDTAPPAGPLRDVVAELKKTFPFQGYKLLETIALRTRVGEESQIEGLLPEPPSEGTPPKKYVFQCRIVAIEPRRDAQLVRFGFVRATIRLPIVNGGNVTYEDVRISTGIEIPDGKTVVVGKAGATGESQGYLLVLTAKVVK
jgi:hypothetical protein